MCFQFLVYHTFLCTANLSAWYGYGIVAACITNRKKKKKIGTKTKNQNYKNENEKMRQQRERQKHAIPPVIQSIKMKKYRI